ncbi:hypothetical protein PSU4_12910 [Pseudonocardia sulfidoxydans NBRC 16205]|uniref:Uncharacterized protein n=1 Tax=Pseudonocardia sulfidoxydans NBRC 16205 TaxID=1223511 RepID=A0A511DCQ3_9PSEU|nr:hypothetical protein [Pseudonocardia sulfidoxydans]GEL22337.1 hypothetical protein PSU4_12910 [Pseudonocardia sulfidoxydans NBRC 16205]
MSNEKDCGLDDTAVDPDPEERRPPEVPADKVPADEEGQAEPTVVPRAGAPSQSMEPPQDSSESR